MLFWTLFGNTTCSSPEVVLAFCLYEGSTSHNASDQFVSCDYFFFVDFAFHPSPLRFSSIPTSLFIHPHTQKSKGVRSGDLVGAYRICTRQLQTAVSPHPLKIEHMFIWTYLLGIVHTTTSYNIYYSSWNTLYIVTFTKQTMLFGFEILK
jgi:hypothetical protein